MVALATASFRNIVDEHLAPLANVVASSIIKTTPTRVAWLLPDELTRQACDALGRDCARAFGYLAGDFDQVANQSPCIKKLGGISLVAILPSLAKFGIARYSARLKCESARAVTAHAEAADAIAAMHR